MPSLDVNQLTEFLTTGSHVMRLATLTSEGWPSVNPVWYHYDGEGFLLAGRTQAKWVENLKNDGRVSACIDTCDAPYTRVVIEGRAEMADANWFGDWKPWAIRYLGDERGSAYYEQTKHIPRVLIRITPNKLTSWAGAGWHPRYNE